MTLADKFTLSRIIVAPVFFLVFQLYHIFPAKNMLWTIPALFLMGTFAELTDFFDGWAARKRGEISDFGKLFDPFADTLLHITFFLCFVMEGIFPAFLFLLVLYREFCVLLIRNLMIKKGITMGARIGGKIKTVTYVIAAIIAYIAVSFQRAGVFEQLYPIVRNIAIAIFVISVVFSILSFIDYVLVYLKTNKAD